VDRLDLEATRTIKNLGKKLPGALSRSGIIGFAERQQVRRELAVLQPHPFGEASSDTVRHFGRGSLREGQAEDRFRACALQQQPEYACRKHLRFAGPGGSRKGGMDLRIGRARLLPLQLGKDLETGAHAAFQACFDAIESGP
jgi:hypothetical protein